MEKRTSRRTFLGTASVAVAAPAIAGTSSLWADDKPASSLHDLESLVGRILDTPRDRCVQVLAGELRRGLSYRQLLAGLFHAAVRFQSTHEVAMMLSAHRISGELPVRDGLLPLFWAFDSLARQIDKYRSRNPLIRPLLTGPFPPAAKAMQTFHDAMQAQDRDTAELAAVSLARSVGTRQTVELVWRYACRDSDNLGHKAIACANARRTLDAVGWEHAEIPLRYMLGGSARGTDATYVGSQERVDATLAKLPPDWASAEADDKATLEVYEELRAARTTAAADLVCQQLVSGKVQAGSVWDAIHLAAADLLYRFKTREDIGGWPVHAVTSSNELHSAFRTALDSQTRLLLLLQATSRISDQMTRLSLKNGLVRDVRITELEPAEIPAQPQDAIEEVFSLLPRWGDGTYVLRAIDRQSYDQACRKAFALLRITANRPAFIRATCEHLNRKATWNAHDFKFPAAAFEDVGFISERWRPHFLAATVHALHGPASADTPVFAQAREMLREL